MLARSEYPIKVLSLIEKLIIMEIGPSPCQKLVWKIGPESGCGLCHDGVGHTRTCELSDQPEARFGGPGRQARRAFRLQVKKQFRSLYMYVRACILRVL